MPPPNATLMLAHGGLCPLMALPASLILKSNCCGRFWELFLCLLRCTILISLGRCGPTLVIGTLPSYQNLLEYCLWDCGPLGQTLTFDPCGLHQPGRSARSSSLVCGSSSRRTFQCHSEYCSRLGMLTRKVELLTGRRCHVEALTMRQAVCRT